MINAKDDISAISATDRRWAWVEVDLNAIRHNIKETRKLIGPNTKVMAVVKADGYGHGAVQVARTALNSGAMYLGVATIDEAVELREAGINEPILLLSQPPETAIPLLVRYEVMPALYTAEFAIKYGEAADAQGKLAPYHLAVNTGMNRIGVNYFEVVEFVSQISFHRALKMEGIFTHFATADSPVTFEFERQLDRFTGVVYQLKNAGINPGIVHAANSPATYRFPQARFDMVRVGLSMYGLYPSDDIRQAIKLIPAMSVRAKITDERIVTMGDGVGYGLNYRARAASKICTIPIGYDDGLMRCLSGKISILYKGRRFAQVGNICMDQCMFEIDMGSAQAQTTYNAQIGDMVTIVGADGNEFIGMDELAQTAQTISYELCCGFSHRLPIVYV